MVAVAEKHNEAPHVLVERDGAILIVTINRPHVGNAINRATSEAIAEAVDRLDADSSFSVGIITGAGGHFCSGMDLRRFSAANGSNSKAVGLAVSSSRRRKSRS